MYSLKVFCKILFVAIFIGLKLEQSSASGTGTPPVNVTNGFYIETSKKGNWFAAFNGCSAKHMNLVVLDTKEKTEALTRELKKVYGNDHPNIWIGGNDTAKNRQFVWITAKKNFTYTNWAGGQPDNKRGVEHCVMLWENHNYKWNDGDCLSKMLYVCEERK
ncbi:lectin subunit alpha-like [Musca vetustissima]|uniref:lectin subunit alpha-like n=1 Tax=Musca vetustissima TaxID=27455 RepID=UPI002AB615B8|nr:lectin subunit alpha-like [Musca vetustissima]